VADYMQVARFILKRTIYSGRSSTLIQTEDCNFIAKPTFVLYSVHFNQFVCIHLRAELDVIRELAYN
jgi:hypothetical protein